MFGVLFFHMRKLGRIALVAIVSVAILGSSAVAHDGMVSATTMPSCCVDLYSYDQNCDQEHSEMSMCCSLTGSMVFGPSLKSSSVEYIVATSIVSNDVATGVHPTTPQRPPRLIS